MNINDIKTDAPDLDLSSDMDRLDFIHARQTELMRKYGPIEQRNGFYYPYDDWAEGKISVHNPKFQHLLKDMAWRCIEELTEATESMYLHRDIVEHAHEEMADSYHFLTELLIWCGITGDDIIASTFIESKPRQYADCRLATLFSAAFMGPNSKDIPGKAYLFVENMGKAMNMLKNKPWKTTHMTTDEPKFIAQLIVAHNSFLRLCKVMGMDHNLLYLMYFKKSEVNKFRQKSNY